MIVSVASGKGGTGKTTVATNMAYSLDEKVQLLDCDVEEPNAHLFLNPEIEFTEPAYAMVPEVDSEKCSYCNKCAEICRYSAITLVGETVLTFPELCHGCGGCVEVCPEQAIAEGRRELGQVELGKCGTVDFGHGRLRVGEAMSPPLIKAVRNHAHEQGAVIIDAPPGTSCPVIAAMNNADFVLLVTEPTPFGLHDLQLAVEAVKLLKIPCGLVINRSDLGTDKVHKYAQKEGIPILLEIQFDRKIAEAYSRGNMLADINPDWRKSFAGLYRKIEMLAEC
ncbi:ATP-binding protein [Desulfopila sp. IMCC35008]|uniref:ATP-binding protein n=1 Tax=Desulfopila sp. IMCC35008 TaxID=2653858 RepID=UPI0013D75327|nr:ATP-binding protein [Desulfopila sp. IMCC35008]